MHHVSVDIIIDTIVHHHSHFASVSFSNTIEIEVVQIVCSVAFRPTCGGYIHMNLKFAYPCYTVVSTRRNSHLSQCVLRQLP